MSEDKALNKLRILLNAVSSLDEEAPDFYADLKEAAWNVLLENPGAEYDEWVQILLEQYPTEVVDALGSNPGEVYSELANLWESEYQDPQTGIEQKLSEWSMSFANECATGIYYFLVDACSELKRLGKTVPILK